MTAKEAIEIIKIAAAQIEWDHSMEYQVAFDKAIEALQREAEIEESTAWFKEALESGYFEDHQYNARHPEAEDDSSTDDSYIVIDPSIDKAINESDVIDAIGEWIDNWKHIWEPFVRDEAEGYLIKKIRKLPPVQLARSKGRWIGGYCSCCGQHAPYWSMASTYYESHYCQNCGAEMRD